MTEAIEAYPLTWPAGWRRLEAHRRTRAAFSKKEPVYRDGQRIFDRSTVLTTADSIARVQRELALMGAARETIVISTNVPTRIDGLPYSKARMPDDPGAAVYWRKGKETRCMAIDRYDRVQDNLAAIAATLEAMRAIERHGGATILDRAFQGFTALPSPVQPWQVLGLSTSSPSRDQVEEAYRRLAMKHHPDRNQGNEDAASQEMARINGARDLLLEENSP